MHFRGHVDKRGLLILDEPGRWAGVLAAWKGRAVSVEIEAVRMQRSSAQNRWYWGVIVPAVADYLSAGRALPISRDDAHYLLRGAFLGREPSPHGLGGLPKSTRTLTTDEFGTYCERIQAHAASEWALNIPSPGDGDEEGPR